MAGKLEKTLRTVQRAAKLNSAVLLRCAVQIEDRADWQQREYGDDLSGIRGAVDALNDLCADLDRIAATTTWLTRTAYILERAVEQ